MKGTDRHRTVDLATAASRASLKPSSILCLPLGATEQHGAHLPFETDVVVADGLARAIVERWGAEFDVWQLPTVEVGLSREHDWSPGTKSLSVDGFSSLMRGIAGDIARSPARNLLIVNGHGGNRGILENLLHEFFGDFSLNSCVVHPFDLSKAETGATYPDVHGGKSETSMMLALAPELVRRDKLDDGAMLPDAAAIRALVFDRGVTWPWRTDDSRLAHGGIVGDARGASAELGRAIIDSIVAEARGVLMRLLENQALMCPPSRR